jgi:hypothetical protein
MANPQIHTSTPPELKTKFEDRCSEKFYDKSKIVCSLIEKWLIEEEKGEQS